ncbi:MAG: pirin family protein [Thiogranum sp.]|nr:pirin family protein [Thiogranum sp.]
MEILQRSRLPRTSFAGVREHRLVTDSRQFGEQTSQSWNGLADFVYLADARLVPGGETGMHAHQDIDVITLMVEGALEHRGSLQDKSTLASGQVLVQRSGGDGFSHNEINPAEAENRLIQIWVLPANKSGPATSHSQLLESGGITRVYGGDSETTLVDIATLKAEQSIDINVPFIGYVCRGKGFANEDMVDEGDLLRAEQLTFDATSDVQLIIIHQAR